MIVYWSMLIYIFVVGYLGQSFVEKYNIRHKYNNGISLFFAVAVLILPVFFIGLRTNYVDTGGYIKGFTELSKSFSIVKESIANSKAPLWIIYEWIIKRFITDNANAFLMITAIIQAIALLKLFYKYSTSYVYSMLIFFLACNFTWMMNGIRQFLAVTIIALFSDFIFEKKTLKFMLVVFICYFIHSTAILWVPIYFLVQSKPWSKKIIFTIILTVLAVAFTSEFTNLLTDALEETTYSNATQQFANDDGSNFVSTIIFSMPALISIWKRKKIAEIAPRYVNVLINISVMGVALSLVANFTSGILIGRLPIYCIIFNYALLPWLFEKCFDSKDCFILKSLCLLGYLGYFCYYTLYTRGGLPYISTVLGINC